MRTSFASVWLDETLLFEEVPLLVKYSLNSQADIVIFGGHNRPGMIWVDDVRLWLQDADSKSWSGYGEIPVYLLPVSSDDFENYAAIEFPHDGGWKRGGDISNKENIYCIDYYEYSPGQQSFRLESRNGQPVLVMKSFALPERVPFDVSNGNFKIVLEPGENNLQSNGNPHKDESLFLEMTNNSAASVDGHGPNLLENQEEQNQSQSEVSAAISNNLNTYYVYSFDGKLMAEYNNDGACVRDYIYMGNRLLAEYRPQENKYYYYTSDQVNSTRMITDDAGAVVYSATFDPYGGLQKTWVSSYTPALKFSGKERDASTDMDYFGARYYDHLKYRFLTPDPVNNKEEAMSNPQLWNMYAYCRNNPVSFVDLDGRTDININILRFYEGKKSTIGMFYISGTDIAGYTMEPPWKNNEEFRSCIPADKSYKSGFRYSAKFKNWLISLMSTEPRTDIEIHWGTSPEHTKGCILLGKRVDLKKESLIDMIESEAEVLKVRDYIAQVFMFDVIFKHEFTNLKVNMWNASTIFNFIKSKFADERK